MLTAKNNSVKSLNRNFGLDIYRALAICLIIFGHGAFFLEQTFLQDFPYIRMLNGVDLFFVLSGFLIGGILLKEINKENKFGIKALGNFWRRRWMRTLPAYYLILLANYFFVKYDFIHGDLTQFNWTFLVFLQNFSAPFYDFFWESWSLSIEEWFYIIAPVLLIVGLFFLRPKQAFLGVTILLLIFSFLYRWLNVNYTIDEFWYGQTYRKVVLMRLDSIAFGLLAAWLFYYYKEVWEKLKFVSLGIAIGLTVFILKYEPATNTFYMQVLYFSLASFAAMLMLPFAQSIQSGKTFVVKIITHISKISYSMYLINLALVADVFRYNVTPKTETDGILNYIWFWVIVVAGSSILYYFFEKPIMELRDRKQKVK